MRADEIAIIALLCAILRFIKLSKLQFIHTHILWYNFVSHSIHRNSMKKQNQIAITWNSKFTFNKNEKKKNTKKNQSMVWYRMLKSYSIKKEKKQPKEDKIIAKHIHTRISLLWNYEILETEVF